MAGLLVSVRDAREAAAALAGGAGLIDVKEPRHGPLGRAAAEVVRAVLDAVAAARPVSAAMGELADWPPGEWPHETARLTFVKWGLARAPADWAERLRRLHEGLESSGGGRVVAAAYADHRRAEAPAPFEICDHAIRAGLGAFLLDTWGKDGSRLLDWMSFGEVRELRRRCGGAGVAFAVAGSLGAGDLVALAALAPEWFAVRGAACRGGREGEIDAGRVRALAGLLGGREG